MKTGNPKILFIHVSKSNQKKGFSDTQTVAAIIERKGYGYVALCPELDIASEERMLW